MTLASTLEIIAELKMGQMVIIVDDEDRENEGDLVIAAEFVTPESINFMAKYGRGLICLTMTQEHCKKLHLPLMTQINGTRYGTAFTVSIEAANGVTTGISAADRAHTIRTAINRDVLPEDIVQPGHIFPIMAQPGGVLQRAGHTEAGCDFTLLSGLVPASVICEIIKDDGTMARLPDLIEFSKKHNMKIGTIADLIKYRSQNELVVERITKRKIRTTHGLFDTIIYRDSAKCLSHIAFVLGSPSPDIDIPIYVNDSMSILDILETDKQSTIDSWTFNSAMRYISQRNRGVAILLDYDNSSTKFDNEKNGEDTLKQWTADFRMFGIMAQILRELGICKIQALADPYKLKNISDYGIQVTNFLRASDSQ